MNKTWYIGTTDYYLTQKGKSRDACCNVYLTKECALEGTLYMNRQSIDSKILTLDKGVGSGDTVTTGK